MDNFYNEFIADNGKLMTNIMSHIRYGGQRILLTAGCGSGKTYFMLTTLVEELVKEDKQLILTVPTSLQAEQNAGYEFTDFDGETRHVKPVTGTSKERIVSNYGCFCSVYDLNAQILDLPAETLAKIVFVVDEAHQLQTAMNYRKVAIENTLKAAAKITACGGTVIFMTGTPRRLEDCEFDETIRCIKVDEAGNPVPQINFDNMYVLSRASKATSFDDCVINEIVSILRNSGHPIVRINDKEMIRRVSLQLMKLQYRVKILTSADKTCSVIDGRKKYASDVYESVVESNILPDADCYLVTSVLEVGTSITGIQRNGEVVQDRTLTPVCVVTKGPQFDMDELAQFFARPRFKIDNAYLILNFAENQNKQAPSLGSLLCRATNDACIRKINLEQESSLMEFDRSLVRSLKGDDERENLKFDTSSRTWSIDFMQLRNAVCKKYDKSLFFCRNLSLVPALAEMFGIHQDKIHMGNCANGQKYDKVTLGTLPAEFDADVKQYLSKKEIRDSLASSVRPELSSFGELYDFSKKNYLCSSGITISGNEVLSRINKLTLKYIYTVDQAIGFVKKQYADGKNAIYLDEEPNEYSKRQDPLEFAASIAAIHMAQEPFEKRNRILWYYESHYLGKDVPYGAEGRTLRDDFDDADVKKYTVMLNSHYFSAIYKAYSLVNNMMDICDIMAQPFADTEEGAITYIHQLFYSEMNSAPRKVLANSALQSTAEYNVLTNLGCYIPDYNFEEQFAKNNKKVTRDLGKGNISFQNFDRNKRKVLDIRALKWIAYNMLSSMRTHMRRGRFTGSYGYKDILILLERIYAYTLIHDENGNFKAIALLHPRRNPYIRAGKDKRLEFLNKTLMEGSKSRQEESIKYASDMAKAGLHKLYRGKNRLVGVAATALVNEMLHIDRDGEIQEQGYAEAAPTEDDPVYSFTANYRTSFYVDHSIEVMCAYFEDHVEKIGYVESFMDLVANGTYELYCEKLHLRTDPRIDCSWTNNPPIKAAA